jgi:hypothetical protein
VRRGLLAPPGEQDGLPDPLSLEEPAQAACYAASVQGRMAFGREAGSRIPRTPDGLPADRRWRPLTAEVRGFNLNAATTVERGDRQGLYRLVKYVTRPPLAQDRLSWTADGRIALELKTSSARGPESVLFTPDGLLQHLCGMVPRPRSHRLLYSGILAPAARHRALLVPSGEPRAPACEAAPASKIEAERAPGAPSTPPTSPDPGASKKKRVRKLLWAELMRRSLGPDGPDPLLCPQCGSPMRPIATLVRADVLRAILASLGLKTEPPRIQPSRGPPDFEEVVEVRPGPPGEDDLLEIRWT